MAGLYEGAGPWWCLISEAEPCCHICRRHDCGVACSSSPSRKPSVYRMFWTILVAWVGVGGGGKVRVWMLTSVLGTLISSHVPNVFVGVNCLDFDALMGSPGSRFEEAPGLSPREPQRCHLWCEDYKPTRSAGSEWKCLGKGKRSRTGFLSIPHVGRPHGTVGCKDDHVYIFML